MSVLRVTFKCSNFLLPDSLFLRDSVTHNCLTTVSTPVLLEDEYLHFLLLDVEGVHNQHCNQACQPRFLVY